MKMFEFVVNNLMDIILVLGILFIATGAFLISIVIGFFTTGAILILLSIAMYFIGGD